MSDHKPAPPLERQADDGERVPPGRNLDDSPLAWLARRKDKDGTPMISEAEFKAGERLREDFTFAQMAPNVTANWSLLLSEGSGKNGSPDHGAQLSDNVHAARERVRRALKAAGPEMADVLIDVCCFLQGLEMIERRHRWPQRRANISCASRCASLPATTASSATLIRASRRRAGSITGAQMTIGQSPVTMFKMKRGLTIFAKVRPRDDAINANLELSRCRHQAAAAC